jgi:hypothetical protein
MEAPFKRGNVSESVVLSHYLRAGFIVSTPFGVGAPYDLVVDTGALLFRAQVKTGRLRGGVIEFETRRTRSRTTRSRYAENEADYFVIYCPELERVYAMKARQGIFGKLRVEPTGNNQQMYIRWADDYSFAKHVEELKTLSLAQAKI